MVERGISVPDPGRHRSRIPLPDLLGGALKRQRGRIIYLRGTVLHDWIQAFRVEPEPRQEGGVEADSGVGYKALTDHPAEGNSREAVGIVVLDRASAYV